MSGKQGAYGARAQDTDFRKKWDKEEYAEKARKRDEEEKERMKENEELQKQGACVSVRRCLLCGLGLPTQRDQGRSRAGGRRTISPSPPSS